MYYGHFIISATIKNVCLHYCIFLWYPWFLLFFPFLSFSWYLLVDSSWGNLAASRQISLRSDQKVEEERLLMNLRQVALVSFISAIREVAAADSDYSNSIHRQLHLGIWPGQSLSKGNDMCFSTKWSNSMYPAFKGQPQQNGKKKGPPQSSFYWTAKPNLSTEWEQSTSANVRGCISGKSWRNKGLCGSKYWHWNLAACCKVHAGAIADVTWLCMESEQSKPQHKCQFHQQCQLCYVMSLNNVVKKYIKYETVPYNEVIDALSDIILGPYTLKAWYSTLGPGTYNSAQAL